MIEFDPGKLNAAGKDTDGNERNCLLAWVKDEGKSSKIALAEVIKYFLWCVDNSSAISITESNRISRVHNYHGLGKALIIALKSTCIFPEWEKQGLSLMSSIGGVGGAYIPSNTAQFRLWCENLLKVLCPTV